MDELDLLREYASVFGKGTVYHYYIFSKGGFTAGLYEAQARRGSAGNAAGALSINQPSGILYVTVGGMFEEQQYCSNAVQYQFTRLE